jgi:DNA-binding protein HU-beta
MYKAELIDAIAIKAELPKKQAEAAVNAVFTTIRNTLLEGDKVQITGFGTFEVKDRPARTGRNPSTGEEMEIPAARVPVFKAGRTLKQDFNTVE